LRLLEEIAVAAEGTCSAAKERQETLEEEQRATLRLALSAPQLQVVVFESHSAYPQETRHLLIDEIEVANESAREKLYVASRPPVRGHSLLPDDGVTLEPRSLEETSIITAEQMTARSNSTIVVR
jgi:hypothetical protein